jgi:predicted amidophosphoribosyltransferase
MDMNIRTIAGNWDAGYALDKHVRSSIYVGDNSFGHAQFSTTRSEVGEALYQLKYRHDWSKAAPLAAEIATAIVPLLGKVELIIPMPASNIRQRQPVNEIAEALGKLIGIPVFEGIVVKAPALTGERQLKDIRNKEDKVAALQRRFLVQDAIGNQGCWNALVVDDLFDTGASMEAACAALRTYSKIKQVFVAALTWK